MIVCEPTVVSEVVVYVAEPPVSVAVPSSVDPAVKVTLPVGAGPLLVTVAMKVTLCPAKLGLPEEVTATTEVAWLIVTVTGEELSAAE